MHVDSSAIEVLSLVRLVAALGEVEVRPVSFGLIGPDADSSCSQRKQPGHRQGVITNELSLQPSTSLPPEQAIPGVGLLVVGSNHRGALVGLAYKDRPQKLLYVPAILNKFERQPVQQLRMAWNASLGAKVIESLDDPSPHEQPPGPVDEHPRDQWVVFSSQPTGEGHTGTPCLFTGRIAKKPGGPGVNHLAGIIQPVPPGQDPHFTRFD